MKMSGSDEMNAIKLSDGRIVHEDDYFELSMNTSDDYWYLIYDEEAEDMVDRYCTKEDFEKLMAFLKNPKRQRLTINGDTWNESD